MHDCVCVFLGAVQYEFVAEVIATDLSYSHHSYHSSKSPFLCADRKIVGTGLYDRYEFGNTICNRIFLFSLLSFIILTGYSHRSHSRHSF